MYKLATTAAFSLMLILLTSVAVAQNQSQLDAQAILKKVEETYRNLKSYQLEYRLKTERAQEGDGLKSTYSNEEAGKISVVKPGKANVEWRSTANKQMAVSD